MPRVGGPQPLPVWRDFTPTCRGPAAASRAGAGQGAPPARPPGGLPRRRMLVRDRQPPPRKQSAAPPARCVRRHVPPRPKAAARTCLERLVCDLQHGQAVGRRVDAAQRLPAAQLARDRQAARALGQVVAGRDGEAGQLARVGSPDRAGVRVAPAAAARPGLERRTGCLAARMHGQAGCRHGEVPAVV